MTYIYIYTYDISLSYTSKLGNRETAETFDVTFQFSKESGTSRKTYNHFQIHYEMVEPPS